MLAERVPDSSTWRERQRVLFWCAPLILVFWLVDYRIAADPMLTLLVRAPWALLVAAAAWSVTRVAPVYRDRMMFLLAATAPLFFAVLIRLTGGTSNPMFHSIVVMPLVVCVVMQDLPYVTAAAAVTTVVGGVGLLMLEGKTPGELGQWGMLSTSMCALAVYASSLYRRMREREDELQRQHLDSLARAQAYRDALDARDQFLTVASHELRTPLTALKLQAQHVGRTLDQSSPERVGRALGLINRQADRLQSLIDRLLDVSLIRAGRLTLEPTETDLNAVVEGVVRRVREENEGAGNITFESSGMLRGKWDALATEQVVLNLLSNALKYGQGKPIHVRLSQTPHDVKIEVEDHGLGVAPQDHERIFKRFERAVPVRNYGGLGLGLWISRQLAEAMGGTVKVQSELGKGSIFTVTLPKDPAAATSVATMVH